MAKRQRTTRSIQEEKKKMLNKKAQGFGIIAFVGVVVVILILAPILINIVTTTLGEVSDNINNTSPTASNAIDSVETSFTNLWDLVIIMVFLLNIILLFLTAFFIDTHPAFMILYIMFAFFAIVFIPNIMDAVDAIYDQYSADVGAYLPLTEFLVNNFSYVLLAVIALSGIILYAKIKYFNSYNY